MNKNIQKLLCKFPVKKKVESELSEKKKDEKGQEITITKKIKKVEISNFAILKPARRHYEGGEMCYAVKLSEGLKAGLLTKVQVQKRYENDGGILSDFQKKRSVELRNRIFSLEREYLGLSSSGKSLVEVDDSKLEIVSQMNDVRAELYDIDNSQQYLFDQTAEVKARNKTILWWVLQLALKQSDKNPEEYVPIFDGEKDEDKFEQYDKMEDEEDIFSQELLKKFAYYVSYWYVSKITEKDDFVRLEQIYNESANTYTPEFDSDIYKEPEAPKVEEVKAVEAKVDEVKVEEVKVEEVKVEEVKVEEVKVEEPAP